MARAFKRQKSRHIGFFAYVNLPLADDHKTKKFQKVGHLLPTVYQAMADARKHYGANAEIRVKGAVVNLDPLDFAPGPKQVDYSCGSSREGKF